MLHRPFRVQFIYNLFYYVQHLDTFNGTVHAR